MPELSDERVDLIRKYSYLIERVEVKFFRNFKEDYIRDIIHGAAVLGLIDATKKYSPEMEDEDFERYAVRVMSCDIFTEIKRVTRPNATRRPRFISLEEIGEIEDYRSPSDIVKTENEMDEHYWNDRISGCLASQEQRDIFLLRLMGFRLKEIVDRLGSSKSRSHIYGQFREIKERIAEVNLLDRLVMAR